MRNAFLPDVALAEGIQPARQVAPEAIEVRKAMMSDIPSLLRLINGYAAEGIMLPRTELEISENIREFSVARLEGRVVACGALHFYSPFSAEVRSLAVDPGVKSKGLGRRIVESLEAEARFYELASIFAFTYVTGFFSRLGFVEVERGELPLKAWKDCLRCPKFQSCDEIAMVKYLTPHALHAESGSLEPGESVVFPILKQR